MVVDDNDDDEALGLEAGPDACREGTGFDVVDGEEDDKGEMDVDRSVGGLFFACSRAATALNEERMSMRRYMLS